MIPAETVKAACDKSILSVAQQCGAVLRRKGSEWNGPCPACGGHDRFWLNEAKNTFLCRMSGAAGDPIELIRHQNNCSFAEAVEMLTGSRSMPVSERRASTRDDHVYREKARRRAWAVWQTGRAIEIGRGGHLVMRYLSIRGIEPPRWRIPALREIDMLAYWHWSKERREFVNIYRGPAMLGAITGPDGRFIGVHRTWLDLSRANGKAVIADPETGEVLDAKKVEGSQRGGKIVLRAGARDFGAERPMLGLGEGIETTVSWAELRHEESAALWCGINLDNMAGKAKSQIPHTSLTTRDTLGRERKVKVGGQEPDPADTGCLHVPTDSFSRIMLLGDGDSDHYTTQAAMLRARRRHEAAGHDVAIDWAADGSDFNDMLRARSRARAVA